MSMADALRWDTVVNALEDQAPVWAPGTTHGYHATTFGWLVGQMIRLASGQTVGEYVMDEIADPLGLDLWIGLPPEQHHRVAPLEVIEIPSDPSMAAMVDQFLGPESKLGKALFAPGGAWREHMFESFNRPEVWQAEVPAANGITNARSLAKLYAATIGPVAGRDGKPKTVFDDSTVNAVGEVQTDGPDTVLMDLDIQYGLGFNLPGSIIKLGGPRSFGHYGAGGSVGFADPDAQVGFGYVMNKMFMGLTGDPRTMTLIDATYAALAAAGA
jgi:CubicO group peptidase (beta-lactamase class C family)